MFLGLNSTFDHFYDVLENVKNFVSYIGVFLKNSGGQNISNNESVTIFDTNINIWKEIKIVTIFLDAIVCSPEFLENLFKKNDNLPELRNWPYRVPIWLWYFLKDKKGQKLCFYFFMQGYIYLE